MTINKKKPRRARRSLAGVGAVVALVCAIASGVAQANPVFSTMNDSGGVYWRSAPDWNTPIAQSGFGHYPGTQISVSCYASGTTVPGSSNTMWVQASWVGGPGRGSGWINEHMVNDGAPINQAAAGVPPCGGGSSGSGSGGNASTVVWVGAPAAGNWPTAAGCAGAVYPSANCSLPSVHHTPFGGDWAYDQQGMSAGTPLFLYAAPQNTALNNEVVARVASIQYACAPYSGESPAATVSRGGYAVKVAIYDGSAEVGTITYVHVSPTVSAGQAISRWGAEIGTVGSYSAGSCWTGVHAHIELYNERNYSCYNRGWSPGQPMNATNFIGFLGGAFATQPRQPCP